MLQWTTLIGPPLKHWRAMSEVHSAQGSWAWHRYCFSNEEFNTSSFKFSQREKSTFVRFYIQISFTLTFFFNNDLDLPHDKCFFFKHKQRFVKQARRFVKQARNDMTSWPKFVINFDLPLVFWLWGCWLWNSFSCCSGL